MIKIITLEGNIGAGKSTLIEKLQEKYQNDPSIIFLKEPVDIWEQIKDETTCDTILKMFYANPAKYAFPFQVMAYITRLSLLVQTVKANPDARIIICERSLEADKNIFAKMLHDDGVIDSVCYQIYERVFAEFTDQFAVSGIVYIDADPGVCASRIMKRARDGEGGIALDYLQKCKNYHDKWLLDKPCVLHLITNDNATYMGEDDCGVQWIYQVDRFIGNMLDQRL
jgi:deoxyadenosine/deoxycytidine kinase